MGIEEIIKAKKAHEENPQPTENENEKPEETDYYRKEGTRNGVSMLRVYRMNGSSIAYNYIDVESIDYSDDITILISLGIKITIKGRNLDKLADMLMGQHIKWVKPHYGTVPPDDGKLMVESIKIESVDLEKELDKQTDYFCYGIV